MIRIQQRNSVGAALCVALAIGLAATAQAAPSVTFLGSTTSSNYSDTGLDIGNSGFWFANFGASTAQSGQPINANAASSLPSWLTVDPTPDTTFASTVTSKGGQAGWATLTLPDGTTGLSGAVVDSNSANNSNNSIRQLQMGPGHPRDFILHIVTDNTAGQHDPASRLRARAERTGVFDVSGPNTPAGLGANMNGTPDVYSFLYNDMTGPAFIKLQLNSGNALEQASIAGFMIDPAIPEPSSAVLLMLGAGVFGWLRRRRG